MRTIQILSLGFTSAALLIACGDSTGTGAGSGGGSTTGSTTNTGGGATTATTTTTTTTTGTGGAGGGTPAIPALGPQVDRMGRPAINTALNDTFLLQAGGVSTTAAREASQDNYNEDDGESTWAATYTPTFAKQLGVLDSIDTGLGGITNETACENQLVSCGDITDTTGCYNLLAGALAVDRLWVDTEGTACTAAGVAAGGYLTLEANALVTAGLTDCGGRRPVDDVISRTYTLLALGPAAGLDAFDDGITKVNTAQHPLTFPYLGPPVP